MSQYTQYVYENVNWVILQVGEAHIA